MNLTRDDTPAWIFYPAALLWGMFVVVALTLMWLVGVPLEIKQDGIVTRYRWFWKLKPNYRGEK